MELFLSKLRLLFNFWLDLGITAWDRVSAPPIHFGLITNLLLWIDRKFNFVSFVFFFGLSEFRLEFLSEFRFMCFFSLSLVNVRYGFDHLKFCDPKNVHLTGLELQLDILKCSDVLMGDYKQIHSKMTFYDVSFNSKAVNPNTRMKMADEKTILTIYTTVSNMYTSFHQTCLFNRSRTHTFFSMPRSFSR